MWLSILLFLADNATARKNSVKSSASLYSCAGNGQCLDQVIFQPNGNILCSVNYLNKETAEYVCNIFKNSDKGCDGILQYNHPALGNLFELVNLNKDSACLTNNKLSTSIYQEVEGNSRPSRRRYRRSSEIRSTVITIKDHGPFPFQQVETYFPVEDVTEVLVEAHLHYSRNTIYRDHSRKVMVAVVGDSCIFGNDDHPINLNNQAVATEESNKDNTISTPKSASIIPSDINLDYLSQRIQNACQTRELLEQQSDLTELVPKVNGNTTVNLTLKQMEENEHPVGLAGLRRRRFVTECHQSYCALSPDGIDLMHVQCINGKCPNMMQWCTYIRLPTTGTTGMRLDTWNHMTMEGYFCVICCMTYNSGGSVVGGAVDARLPTCNAIVMSNQLCAWVGANGRCGMNFS